MPRRGWILLLILAVWSYDTGAYLVGKQFGTAKFLTHISPSKTYAGLVGGVVGDDDRRRAAAVRARPVAAPRAAARAARRAVRAGRRPGRVDAQAGGRRRRTRAQLIPGHGGMLDRVDSFLFAAPDPDPVCRRPPRLRAAPTRRVAGSPCSGRPARSGPRRSTSWRPTRGLPGRRPGGRHATGALLDEQAARLGADARAVAGGDAMPTWSSWRPATTSISWSWPPAAWSASGRSWPPCAPARSWPRPTRRPWSPAATWSCRGPRARGAGRAADPRDPFASPLAWLRPIDSEHSAIWQCLVGESMAGVAALDPDRQRRPVPGRERRRAGRGDAGAGAAPPDLDDGRQDHHRLGDPRQQGPGGHRGALAVRCRLRRDRGGHPPAERRPLRRPLRRRLPQGPAGHPRHAPADPVRHDLPRPAALARRAARPHRRPAASTSARPTRPRFPALRIAREAGLAGPARLGRPDRRR